MATSPAANVIVTGAPCVEMAADDDTLLDVPEEDKRFSLMIESSKTENTDAAPRRKKKTRRGKKKLRRGPPDGGTVVGGNTDGSTIIGEQKDGDTVVGEKKDGGSAVSLSRPRAGDKENTAAADDGAAPTPAKKPRLNRRQRRRRSSRQPAPILRPLEVPRAPRNSTSFLIDDHENSAYYIDFDAAARRTPTGGSDRSRLESSTADEEDAEEAAYQYSMKDFEAVYRHAREEELAQLARPQLVDCVRQLETRVRELEGQLTLYDPEVWVQNLQNQLLHLQEENRLLAKTREVLLKRYDGSDVET